MYSTNLRGGKAFAAEQKICELKKLLFRSKRVQKSFSKRIKPNELIKTATLNLNNNQQNMVSLQHKLKKKVSALNVDNNLKKHMILVGSGE